MWKLATCLVLCLEACAQAPKNPIVGKWQVDAAVKMTVEFRMDGTTKLTMMGRTLQGTYTLTPDNRLEWRMNGLSTRARVKVTARELDLTDDQNRTIRYRRM